MVFGRHCRHISFLLAYALLSLPSAAEFVDIDDKGGVAADLELRNDWSAKEMRLLEGVWPMDILNDPPKQARVVRSKTEFLKEVLIADHSAIMVVFPNGVYELNLSWEESVPENLQIALKDCNTTVDVAKRFVLNQDLAKTYSARLDVYRRGKMIRKSSYDPDDSDYYDYDDGDYEDDLDEEEAERKQEQYEIKKFMRAIKKKLKKVRRGRIKPHELLIAELSFRNLVDHPIGGDTVSTIFSRDVKDVLGPYASWAFHWQRSDAGLFIGGQHSGTGIHVDQTLWSDVGRNFRGYKLVAAWPAGQVSANVLKEFQNTLLQPPLTLRQEQALRQALKVSLLRPGDMYLFSGGVAHTVLCVSDDELCLGAYESIITLHPTNMEIWQAKSGPEHCNTDDMCIGDMPTTEEMHDFTVDSIQNLEDVAAELLGEKTKATRTGLYPAEWDSLTQQLHDDPELQANLRQHFHDAVGICLHHPLARELLPQSVVQASGWAQKAGELAPNRTLSPESVPEAETETTSGKVLHELLQHPDEIVRRAASTALAHQYLAEGKYAK